MTVSGLSDQAYHHFYNLGENHLQDEDGQLCWNAIALGERLLKDVEVVYKGEVILKEPDHYELHAVYQAQEENEESAEELGNAGRTRTADICLQKRTLLVPDPHRFCTHRAQ